VRIAQVIDHLSVKGGSEKTCRRLASKLVSAGHRALIIHGEEKHEPAEDGVETAYVEGLAAANLLRRNRSVYKKMLVELKRFEPDVVHFRNFNAPLIIKAVSSAYPTVRTVHTPWTYCPAGTMYKYTKGEVCENVPGLGCLLTGEWRFCRFRNDGSPISFGEMFKRYVSCRAFRLVDRTLPGIIANSEWTKRFIVSCGIPAETVETVPPPIDLPDGTRANRKNNGSYNVLAVGRLAVVKGFDDFLRAMTGLPDNVRATVAGDGPCRSRLEGLSVELGIAGRVNFTGWVNGHELKRLYESADVFVLPSKYAELFGQVGADANAHGLPVVAYAVGGIPCWLEDKKNGLLVEPGDVDGLADRLMFILTYPELSKKMGTYGRLKIKKDFSTEIHTTKTLRVYEKAVARFKSSASVQRTFRRGTSMDAEKSYAG
jgi:glycosyltransferase involved in cell wall biosynthesis